MFTMFKQNLRYVRYEIVCLLKMYTDA